MRKGTCLSLGNPTANLADQPVEIRLRKATADSKGRREFSYADIQQIKDERKAGATYPELAKKWRCSKSTLSYMLSETARRQGIRREVAELMGGFRGDSGRFFSFPG